MPGSIDRKTHLQLVDDNYVQSSALSKNRVIKVPKLCSYTIVAIAIGALIAEAIPISPFGYNHQKPARELPKIVTKSPLDTVQIFPANSNLADRGVNAIAQNNMFNLHN